MPFLFFKYTSKKGKWPTLLIMFAFRDPDWSWLDGIINSG